MSRDRVFVEFVLPRLRRFCPPGTQMIAVVQARLDPRCTSEQGLRSQLTRAITDWVSETEEGCAALKTCGGQFTVSTLLDHAHVPTLVRALRRHGISKVSVQTFGYFHLGPLPRASRPTTTEWTYDDPLIE